MKVYVIIPARGGSKSLPGKNIKPFLGRPLIAWTIEAAKKVPVIARVIVNTDDDEVAAVSHKYGAEIFRRPTALAEDLIEDLPVFVHHLEHLKSQGDLPDIVVDLRATAPLRRAERITEGIMLLQKYGRGNADSVRAVSRAAKHPYKMWNFEEDNIVPLFSKGQTGINEPYNAPRQRLPDIYQNSGCMNAFWPETVLEKRSMTGDRIKGYVMEDWESVNIDTPVDFLLAEQIMREKKHFF